MRAYKELHFMIPLTNYRMRLYMDYLKVITVNGGGFIAMGTGKNYLVWGRP